MPRPPAPHAPLGPAGRSDVDVAVVGAGAAGLALAWHLAQAGPAAPSVALVEPPPGPATSPQRTWCTWGPEPSGPAAAAVSRVWGGVDVVDPAGARLRVDLAPWAYRQVRSRDYVQALAGELGATRRVTAAVESVQDEPGVPYAVVRGPGLALRAGTVVDTRPPGPPARVRTAWVQHFRGWRVRTAEDVFDPGTAVLMDFRTPQPPRAVSFGYVLPQSPREALVEWTGFGRAPLDRPAYDAALRHYVEQVLGLRSYEIVGDEQGVIPMVDGALPRRVGPRTVRLGGAAGATRPSTGYAFSAVQRQASQVAAALLAGRDPAPPPAYPARHLWMDGLLLRALDTGRVRGAEFFPALFRAHPARRVLRFLDGQTSLAEDLAVMRTAPLGPMAVTAAERLVRRARPAVVAGTWEA